jgi:probable phosphoglycerate mutase
MKVYFVRHGESEGNVGSIRQGPHSPLTKHGRKQANFIADRVARLEVDTLVSSTMKRAVETAEIIGQRIEKPFETSELFIERRRPKEQIGNAKNSPLALEAETAIIQNFTVPGFRYSDEENFDDLKKRAEAALEFLVQKSTNRVVVVTHGFFLRVLAAYAVFGKSLTAPVCDRFIQKFHTENTGITVFGFDQNRTQSPWWLWVWNDHSHLSELN